MSCGTYGEAECDRHDCWNNKGGRCSATKRTVTPNKMRFLNGGGEILDWLCTTYYSQRQEKREAQETKTIFEGLKVETERAINAMARVHELEVALQERTEALAKYPCQSPQRREP